jgi:hypothetical protein
MTIIVLMILQIVKLLFLVCGFHVMNLMEIGMMMTLMLRNKYAPGYVR